MKISSALVIGVLSLCLFINRARIATAIADQLSRVPEPARQLPEGHRLLTDYHYKEIVMLEERLYSNWSSIDYTQEFNFFTSLSGESQTIFVFNKTLSPNASSVHVNTILMIFRDPVYINQNVAILNIPVEGLFNATALNWAATNATIFQYRYYNYDLIDIQEIPNTTFQIDQVGTTLSSPGHFNLAMTTHPFQYKRLLPWLLMLPNLLILAGVHFMNRAQIPPLKLSIFSLFITLNFLLFVSLNQLYYGVSRINSSEGWLVLTGAMTFCCSIRFTQTFEPVIRRMVGLKGYLTFYLLSFVYLWGLFNYSNTAWFLILNSFVLVPQIVHNAYYGIKPGFYPGYIFALLSSQYYIFYYKGCPDNIMLSSPDLPVCLGISLSMLLQVIILYAQFKLGSRFFIPKRCRPNYFDYYEWIDNDLTTGLILQDCAICLLQLTDEPISNSDIEEQPKTHFIEPKKKRIRVMRTPCKHRFHVSCLQSWLEHKFECPIDRSKLPPLQ